MVMECYKNSPINKKTISIIFFFLGAYQPKYEEDIFLRKKEKAFQVFNISACEKGIGENV